MLLHHIAAHTRKSRIGYNSGQTGSIVVKIVKLVFLGIHTSKQKTEPL